MKTTKILVNMVNIEGEGFHLMVDVIMNNERAYLLVDTGASMSVFDKARIHLFSNNTDFEVNEQLSTGLGTNSMESHSIIIQSIMIGEAEIKDYKAILIDLSHVNESYEKIGLKPIDGVIGSDILKKFLAVINYEEESLLLKY